MRKWLLVVAMVCACAKTETVRLKRWPTNRHNRDVRMEKMERQIADLVEQVTKLQTELAALRGGGKPVEPARSDTLTPASTPATP